MSAPARARRRFRAAGVMGLAAVFVLSSCARAPEIELPPTPTQRAEPAPTATPTATPTPPDTALICLAEEPQSLYLYADTNRSADAVLSVIYDGPVDLQGYLYRPTILEQIPSLDNGGAVVEQVPLASGDVYLNPESLEPETLRVGGVYAPSGCRSPDCFATYNGGTAEVDRLRVSFRLAPGMVWSDGEPVRAADSVFSYELDGHADTPTPKFLYARTLRYRALDELTVEWTGIPGFLDSDFASNFWTPLPEHALGEVPPAELIDAEAAARRPLGWGPYQIEEWLPGAEIRLARNPHYQADGEPPAFETVVFRFVADPASALDQLQTGECDVLDEALVPLDDVRSLRSRAEAGEFELAGGPGPVVERMDMNLRPVEGAQSTALFADVGTRQGLAACIDRSAIAEAVYGQPADVTATFLPVEHPLYNSEAAPPGYDPDRGQRLLEEAGWALDGAGAEVRTANGVEGVPDGARLEFDLLTLEGAVPEAVGRAVAEDLRACGVEARPQTLSSGQLFAGWPDGPAFGRRFAAVIWAWPTFATPACEMFAGWEVPSEATPLGINASGFMDQSYDAACRSLLLSPAGSSAFNQAAATVQSRFVERVPSVPLFQRPRIVAHAEWLCGVEMDPSVATPLWNVEVWRPCPPGSSE